MEVLSQNVYRTSVRPFRETKKRLEQPALARASSSRSRFQRRRLSYYTKSQYTYTHRTESYIASVTLVNVQNNTRDEMRGYICLFAVTSATTLTP